jgi:hypothetical protein
MNAGRKELDRLMWHTLHATPVLAGEPLGLNLTGRPANYRELGALLASGVDFELAWREFLHEFYAYRASSFFAEEPPTVLSPGYRAMLAGAAEYLSREFGSADSRWVDRPEFYLDQEWDILSERMDADEFREERRARSDGSTPRFNDSCVL